MIGLRPVYPSTPTELVRRQVRVSYIYQALGVAIAAFNAFVAFSAMVAATGTPDWRFALILGVLAAINVVCIGANYLAFSLHGRNRTVLKEIIRMREEA